MKESTATSHPHSLELPPITKGFPNDIVHSNQAEDLIRPAGRLTEEKIRYLNRIGNEYPFCIYYKPKMNDPL